MSSLWWFAREWRAGELHVLIASLALAVAMVSGISLFTDRLTLRLVGESTQFLAADTVFDAREVLDQGEWSPKLSDNVEVAQTLTFATMVQAGEDGFALVSAKAVSSKYPLRGSLKTSATPFGDLIAADTVPEVGEVWLAPRLFPLLGVALGDSITLGKASLTVGGIIRSEPDAGGSMFDSAPRVLMRFEDIAVTGVVQAASRVSYRLLLAGPEDAVKDTRERLETYYQERVRVRSIDESQPSVAQALDRAERFLLLAGSVGVLLSGVAMLMAARRFGERHFAYVAVLKTLGATRFKILSLYIGLLSVVSACALAIGFALALGLEITASYILKDLITSSTDVAYPLRPFGVGLITLAVCITSFIGPSFIRLAGASPLRVLRQELTLFAGLAPTDVVLAVGGLLFLTQFYTGNWILTGSLLLALSMIIVIGLLVSSLVFKRVVGALPSGSAMWRLASASIQRHARANGFNVVMFGSAIMLMVLLALVRTSLIEQWQNQLPEDAPNHFVVNLQDAEVSAFEQFLQDRGVATQASYPMSRARLIGVNARALTGSEGPERQRETNFSWTDALPEANTLLAGEWFRDDERAEVSVEEEYAQRSGIRLGDTLRYRIGSDEIDLVVTSFREVDWQSMRPNFFVLVEPSAFPPGASTYLSSFYLPSSKKVMLNDLIKAFPTLTVLEIDVIIKQLQDIVASVSKAVEAVLVLIVVAGLLVLIMGVTGTLSERTHENAVLKVFGAKASGLAASVWLEFAAIGYIAGLLGVAAAEIATWGIYHTMFEGSYSGLWWLWLVVPLSSAAIMSWVGWLSCRRSVRVEPIHALRAS
ncbi:ABC transporter permease [Aequoribacter sp.]|uniref:ABC transporter permease n=1 Tax=Aequoribacter sp. TaxID=2847771 RepID=UPI003F6A030D